MLKLIDRYILKALAGPLIFGVMVVLFLFLMQFLMNYLEDLVGKGLSTWVIIQLITLNLAWMVVLAVPIGFLFATLLAFGNLSSAHEVTIIKASGGSLLRMMSSVIILGALLSIGLFWFNDYVLPEANHKSKTLLNDIKRKKPTLSIESGQFSTQLEGFTILARRMDSLTSVMYGVTIYDNSNMNKLNVVSADSGKINFNQDYSKLILRLFSGEIHQMNPGNIKESRKISFDTYRISINANDFAFEQSEENVNDRGDREMRISDMQVEVDKALKGSRRAADQSRTLIRNHYNYLMGREYRNDTTININMMTLAMEQPEGGYSKVEVYERIKRRLSFILASYRTEVSQEQSHLLRAKQFNVEIQKKYAIPFACFVFLFVGCPLGIITRGGNFGISAAISLAFYIFYWVCLIGGEKLADRGMLSPTVSMWAGNFLVGMMGVLLTIKVNSETVSLPGRALFKRVFRIYK